MSRFRHLFWFLPKKTIYIEGNAAPIGNTGAELLEGEAGPVKVTFDENCEYDIVERDISPAKLTCQSCGRTVLAGMDYCNFCGEKQEKEV